MRNNKKRSGNRRTSGYSKEYRQARYEELCQLLSHCKTESEREMLIKAYDVSINP